MNKVLILSIIAVALAGCYRTDASKARRDAYYGDKPALIFCQGYNGVIFDGQSTGKVEYDEGGRYTFVDAANGRLTSVEGECRVVYSQ